MPEEVELLREPQGWNKDETIVQAYFNRQNEFTNVVVFTETGMYAGSTRKHPEDPDDPKTAKQLALQRCQKIADIDDVHRSVQEAWFGHENP